MQRFFLMGVLLLAPAAQADTALVAVASNFTATAEEVAEQFTRETGHKVTFAAGSSGKLYAQISHGAPFNVFLSADVERAAELEKTGRAVLGSRYTYAIGRLALWSKSPRYAGRDCTADLRDMKFGKLAMANPVTAPYGAAAMQVLAKLGLTQEQLAGKIVQGENIAQTLQFVDAGGADLGFVALAQLVSMDGTGSTCRWDVAADLHDPIEQQAVLVSGSEKNAAATGYLAFLKSAAARTIIERHGYSAAP